MLAVWVTPPVKPEDLTVTETPQPQPGPGEVLVRLHAVALNRRDLAVLQGARTPAGNSFVLGSDGAGEVAAVGADVTDMAEGDAVLVYPAMRWGNRQDAPGPGFDVLGGVDNGTFAPYVVLPAENVRRKPEHLSWEEAAALPLAGLTAYRALLSRAALQPGETVLIHGIGGGVALAALQITIAKGGVPIVTSSSDAKLSRARELGAAVTINYRTTGWLAAVREATEGAGVDVVLESVGEATFAGSITAVKPGGRIVTFSTTTGGTPTVNIRELFWKQASILGTTMGSPLDMSGVLELYRAHSLHPVIDRTYPLEQAAQAYMRLAEAEQFGKIVLTIP
jgi:NADPH:quinone reductase-like Zn-dependent oxidoreductase